MNVHEIEQDLLLIDYIKIKNSLCFDLFFVLHFNNEFITLNSL